MEAEVLGRVWVTKVGGGLCHHWGWGQRAKGDWSRFFATEMGIRLGVLELAQQKERGRSAFSLLVDLRGVALTCTIGILIAKQWMRVGVGSGGTEGEKIYIYRHSTWFSGR